MSEALPLPEHLGKYFFHELQTEVENVFKSRAGATWAELCECDEGYENNNADFNYMFIRVQWTVEDEDFDEGMMIEELEQLSSFEAFREDVFVNKNISPAALKEHARQLANELYEEFEES